MVQTRLLFMLGAVALLASGCDEHKNQQSAQIRATQGNAIAQLPIASFAGGVTDRQAATIRNPMEANPDAIAKGHALFLQMNCAGCHGYDLTGGMGPNLVDPNWRYGGTPGAIFQTIYSGRPQGMPSWRHALSTDQIWQLVAFIQSKGGTVPADQYAAGLNGDATSPTKQTPPPPPPDPPPPGSGASQKHG